MTVRDARKRGYASEEYSLPKSWLDISACLVASITLVGTSVSLFVLGIKVTNSTIEVPYLSAVSFGASAFSFAFALIFAIGAASYWRTSSTVTVVHQMDSQDIQRIANEATHEISRVTGRLEGLISVQGKSLTDHRGVTDTLLPIIEERVREGLSREIAERVREGLSRDSGRGPGGYLPLPEKPELDEIPNLDALANVFNDVYETGRDKRIAAIASFWLAACNRAPQWIGWSTLPDQSASRRSRRAFLLGLRPLLEEAVRILGPFRERATEPPGSVRVPDIFYADDAWNLTMNSFANVITQPSTWQELGTKRDETIRATEHLVGSDYPPSSVALLKQHASKALGPEEVVISFLAACAMLRFFESLDEIKFSISPGKLRSRQ